MITVYETVPHINSIHRTGTQAFIKGLQNLGLEYEARNTRDKYVETDKIVIFGVGKTGTEGTLRMGIHRDHKKHCGGEESYKKRTVVIERGFIKRGTIKLHQVTNEEHYSVGMGGANGDADFLNMNCSKDRWESLGIDIKDEVQNRGNKIIVCGQKPNDASVCNINYRKWIKQLILSLRKKYPDNKICFKPHPDALGRVHVPSGTELITEISLAKVLTQGDVFATVAYSSNSSVESLLNGIPTVCCSEKSMVFDILQSSGIGIEDIRMPDKDVLYQWAYNLAYTQWTFKEFTEGLPQKHLGLIEGNTLQKLGST